MTLIIQMFGPPEPETLNPSCSPATVTSAEISVRRFGNLWFRGFGWIQGTQPATPNLVEGLRRFPGSKKLDVGRIRVSGCKKPRSSSTPEPKPKTLKPKDIRHATSRLICTNAEQRSSRR